MKKIIKREFDFFKINDKNIIDINFSKNRKQFNLERILTPILEEHGCLEFLSLIIEDLKKYIVKVPLHIKCQILLFKYLRNSGIPVLLTDFFSFTDFRKRQKLLKQCYPFLKDSNIPHSYYEKLFYRLKDFLIKKNVPLKTNIDEEKIIEKIAFSTNPVIDVLYFYLDKELTNGLFSYFDLNQFCSYDMYRTRKRRLQQQISSF